MQPAYYEEVRIIFEDPKTHLLVGVTPAGKYHIRLCDLNADHFVTERQDRAEIWELLHSAFTVKRNQLPQMDPELVGALRKQAEQMIPKFPHLPKAATVGNGVTH